VGVVTPSDEYLNLHFTVIFKETNQYYRDAIQSAIYDSFVSYQYIRNNYSLENIIFKNDAYYLNSLLYTYHNNGEDSLIFPKVENALNSVDYFYRYCRGGNIHSRLLKNNSIIAFCYGDSIYSNTFGAQIFAGFDKEAVFDFLDEYQSARDYFYSVLYNPSFVAEPNYEIFIKLSIITFAINRWVNIYSSTGKDPGKYNL
jgi:hypothetical protein